VLTLADGSTHEALFNLGKKREVQNSEPNDGEDLRGQDEDRKNSKKNENSKSKKNR
jgi:hypothetical protein